MLRRACFAALATLAAACTSSAAPLELESGATVEVEQVLKGDELEVKRNGQVARVRMLGVHAFSAVLDDPKLEELEAKAQDWLATNVAQQSVRLVLGQVPRDSHGRYLAYVEHSGNDVNRRLIEEGRAVVYTEYPFEREVAYLTAEASARARKQGIWATSAGEKLATGLRKQWRASRNEPDFVDPILDEAPDAVTKDERPEKP